MTQSFAFQEPVCELGQGVFSGPNMMPSWKHPNATFNLLPNDHAGHKRRRSFSAMPPVAQDPHMYNADHLQVPTRRLSNDLLEQCPAVPNFCVGLDAAASQSGFQTFDNRGDSSFYSRTLDNSCDSLRTPPRIESTHYNGAGTYFMDRISSTTSSCMNDFQAFDHANGQSAQTFNHYPRSMDANSAAAVAAQALANFQAGIFTPDTGFLHQRNGQYVANGYTPGGHLSSSGSFFAYPSTGAPITKSTGNVVHNLAGMCNHNVIHDSSFGLGNAHLNGNIHLRAGVIYDFNLQKSNSLTASISNGINGATNVFNSSLGVADHRLERPQSPSTPRVDVGLSESQQDYLQETHRLNAIADEPDSPRQNSRGRRLEYSAPLEKLSRNPFQDLEAPAASHMYYKSDHPVETSTINAATACVTTSETTGRTQRGETLCQPCGPPPSVAPRGDTGDKESRNHKFDLNEVPGFVDATPKPRKKFHPRVAKDKRTYKRRMDVKKNSRAPVVDGINMDSPPKKTPRRANQTSQHDSNHGDGRESSFVEAMDIEVEDIGVVPKSKPVNVQHDTAVCDCEACIKLRLERRAVGQNTRLNEIEDCAMGQRHSKNVFNTAQSPVSPPKRHGRGSWESREKSIDTPDGHDVGGSHESPDSDPRSSPSVRRNLFAASQAQAPAAASEGTWPVQGIGSSTRNLKGFFDANQSSALAISPKEAVRAVIHHPAATRTPLSSSLKQFNQSGTHLDIYDHGQTNLQHLQDMVAQHRDSVLAMNQRNLIYQELHSNMALRNYARESGTIVSAYNPGRVEWNPWFNSFNSIRPAVTNTTSSSFMSRLCPRGILSPQNVTFRMMNQIQRVVYLKFILRSNHQLEMSPKMLLHHVLEHLPESEKEEFKSLWDVILTPVADEQMRQLAEHAQMEIAMPTSGHNHAAEKHHRKPEKAKKPSKRQMQQSKAMTLSPDLMHDQTLSNSKALKEKARSKASNSDRQEQQNSNENEGLEMVPYENKSVVPYDGPFMPLRKRKPRPKVVLDNDTVREWKLLMGKPNGTAESVDTDSEKELKWEEERRKMKAQAQTFIERMHVVQGDRSFSCWKGSVVDSVVGAFLTQNVNDVLSSSAFISMRSRFPGRGFRRNDHSQTSAAAAAAPEETLAQSFDSELAKNLPLEPSASATTITPIHQDPQLVEPQSSAGLQDGSSSYTPSSPTRDVGHSYECPPNLLESQESHNVESYEAQSTQEVTNSSTPQITHSEHSHAASAKTSSNSTVETTELQSGLQSPPQELAPSNSSELSSDGAHNGISKDPLELLEINPDATTEGSELVDTTNPSHGKYNPKTGLTGLERAKIEERQVSARKSFDFSHLEEEFRPRQRPTGLPRTEQTEDGVDWEAVRRADVAEVADVIKERGLNWILAGRIKAFLERLHLDYGALDLEWLRSMSTDQTKEFLLSIRGLGIKSVECIRLLTLHHLAFPVDTNVGRICVRLGWVPLEPLPEELQLHLLELYPVQATIQKYLWPRLCKLDHQTLYELHYQMISFGKVFCTKSKPNCNACPMRPECKHFASAISSAKLALPAPERPHDRPTLALPPGTVSSSGEDHLQPPRTVSQYCQPIVEEPMTPESEANVEDLDDIEDYPFSVEEVEEDAVMNLCIQESRKDSCCSKGQSCKNPSTKEEKSTDPGCCSPMTVMSESKPVQEITLEERGSLSANSNVHQLLENETCPNSGQDTSPKPVIEVVEKETNLDQESPSTVTEQSMSGDANPNGSSGSQEMVLVPPEAASIPVPKLKNVGRLRTVHYVYELPDNHPLLDGLDSREADDPCTYLLAIWSPGEVPESIPNINDNANEENPFASSGSEGDESIKATLLVPCRTAMQGSFPLNGTYFQVNEVFADHASSLQPILVPRTLLWNLRRRFVFFGTSVTSIFRGMTAEEIQACFWRGYVCVRGFDRTTRAPKPLVGRLHLQAGKSSGKGANMEA